MRQLLVQVPQEFGEAVLEIAKNYEGMNLARFETVGDKGQMDLIIAHISNRKIEGFIKEVDEFPELHVTLIPQGVMALAPPASEAPEQVKDVEERSPIEIFLSGLQSIGSWKGFLGYAAVAGVVVWIGLFTSTINLLTAAMLIAPFAGPAMNTAIATARGDMHLLRNSLLRYFAAISVTIAMAGILSLILQQESATKQMVEVSQVSIVAVLLPVAAGVAGALNLVQSERSSLVSGAAIGILVASSLAPPAGLIGMASVMGMWDMVVNGLFVLLLQLVGINLSGSLVFRVYGLSPRGARYERGKKWVFPSVLALTVIILAGLLSWQLSTSPELQRSSRSQRAATEIQKLVDNSDLAKLVEANVRFTRPSIKGQNTLLGVIYVQRLSGVKMPSEEIGSYLTQAIQTHLLEQEFNVTPLIAVNVLEEPKARR